MTYNVAVGRIGELHRAKPGVRGSDEFNFFFAGGALGLKTDAVGNKNFAMDEIAAGVA